MLGIHINMDVDIAYNRQAKREFSVWDMQSKDSRVSFMLFVRNLKLTALESAV